jgi:hypothetical protein
MKTHKIIVQLIIAAVFLIVSVNWSCAANPSQPSGQSETRLLGVNDSNIPAGQAKEVGADIFGNRGGRYHPFVSVQEVYTDNLFTTRTDTKDEFITTVEPGIWLAFPANREKLLSLNTTTTSPGGLKLSRVKPEAVRRYQTYFLYSPGFVFYNDFSNHDHVNHRAEGLFQYNFNSGVSLDLIDIFHDKEEISGNGLADTLYRYQDNLLNFTTTYQPKSGKLKLQFNYSNYDLDYDDAAVEYRDRNDNSFGASVFYKFWPKTALFVEYDYADIEFDSETTNDNNENRYFGGVAWDITAKTKGTLKLGFTDKDFDSSGVEDQDGFSIEFQTQHNLTPKRALQANGYRKFNESDQAGSSSFLSTGIDVSLLQRFTEKWSGTFSVSYEEKEYYGINRDDDYYSLSPGIRFKPKEWMFFDLGYFYYKNDSNDQLFDYEANQVLLRATVSI